MKRIDVNDIVGKKFNRLTVISFSHKKPHPNPQKGYFYFYKCKCECGKNTIVRRERLINLETKSCGCYTREKIKEVISTKRTLSHRLYRIWSGIKARCYNSKSARYSSYGNKGVKMCEEWKNDFNIFYDWAILNGYNDKLTIERVNVNGNYEPNNCIWATVKTQANNRTNNHLIFYNCETHTLSEWAEILKINRSTLWYRIKRGWSVKRAFTTPVN